MTSSAWDTCLSETREDGTDICQTVAGEAEWGWEGQRDGYGHLTITGSLEVYIYRDYPLCLKVEKEIRPSGDLTCDRKQDWWTWILQPQQQWPCLPRGTRRSDQLLTSQWTRHSCRRSLIRFMRSRPLGSSRSFHQKEWKRLGAKNEPLASEKIAENVFIVKIWRATMDQEDSSRNVCINKLKSLKVAKCRKDDEGWMMKDDDFKLLRGFCDWRTYKRTDRHLWMYRVFRK